MVSDLAALTIGLFNIKTIKYQQLKTFTSIFFVLVSLTAKAQSALEKTLLWQITGPGINTPSYLYGTIHLMCPQDIIVSTELRAKFYATKQLFLELDMDDPSVLAKTMTQMNMKNDTTLDQLLSIQQYDSVAASFKQLTGMPLDMMKTMKPQLIESIIYPSLLGCQGAEAWEQKFIKMAKANNMAVKGLEQVEDQLSIFDAIPYKMQAQEFAETILHLDSVKKSFRDMMELYKQKDLAALNKMTNNEDEFSEYSDLLLTNRNEKWIPEIIAQAKLKPTFFAVGAAHLGNESGVINLLRKKGYVVLPVTY
jgi:uncharacterized protein YbaP (TraB family)